MESKPHCDTLEQLEEQFRKTSQFITTVNSILHSVQPYAEEYRKQAEIRTMVPVSEIIDLAQKLKYSTDRPDQFVIDRDLCYQVGYLRPSPDLSILKQSILFNNSMQDVYQHLMDPSMTPTPAVIPEQTTKDEALAQRLKDIAAQYADSESDDDM
ncbi:hypothetical protein BLNAU_7926 [Blattamonas nauphoetae]|uniref:Uncharacterized protein n=1 Tax=Blattamonas nauphoetae TaxID=2049346 RepID=A0ABQ9Y051_9EUKA|nr:hypothetical protein BLNAU_7926 [Blattamonas nauphoetae]